ncbi:MAG: thioredoxin domain-containing protein [Thermomicrobiales bacterium]|nr:thioredoxin domain-containing protein [Thermomicrobiales bacterium]
MSSQLAVPVDEHDHVIGPIDAPVTLVEYGDYQCSDCKAAMAIMRDVQRALGDHVRIVFRHFPLQRTHPYALGAAVAAEAAADQGRFWEYHDRLFQRQPELDRPDLIAYAIAIGLDHRAFEAALDDPALADRVTADFRGGVRSDVNGTPTLYINGARYDGLLTFEGIVGAIEGAM